MRKRAITVLALSGMATIAIFQNCGKAPTGSRNPNSEQPLNPAGISQLGQLSPLNISETSQTSTVTTQTLVSSSLDGLKISINDGGTMVSKTEVKTTVTLSDAVEYEVLLEFDSKDESARDKYEFDGNIAKVTVPAGKKTADVKIDVKKMYATKATEFKLKLVDTSLGTIADAQATVRIPKWTPALALKVPIPPPADYPGRERIKNVTCTRNPTNKRTSCADTDRNAEFFDYYFLKRVVCTSIRQGGIAACKDITSAFKIQPEGGYCTAGTSNRENCGIQKSGVEAFRKRRNCVKDSGHPTDETLEHLNCTKP